MSRPEVFVSIDIETDGAAPGVNSMLALGAAAFLPRSDDGTAWEETSTWYAKLDKLPGASENPDTMKWWQAQPEAWTEVISDPRAPVLAIPDFRLWCKSLPGKPVAVAWPAAFDFAFVNYYCHRFAEGNPLGFACLDIRSYANGLAGYPSYYGLPEAEIRKMAGEIDTMGLRPHVAVDDAIEQGRLFMALRRHALSRMGQP
jgi:3' exoribonuclease, RNase T-like